jgi:hypothetical protein
MDNPYDKDTEDYFRKRLEEEIPKIPRIPYSNDGERLAKIWDHAEIQQPLHEIRYALIVLVSERNMWLSILEKSKGRGGRESREEALSKIKLADGEIRALEWVLLGNEVRL